MNKGASRVRGLSHREIRNTKQITRPSIIRLTEQKVKGVRGDLEEFVVERAAKSCSKGEELFY